jgi:mRNA-degrading endonuclease RelE of RelBE toxin-antitoxin system
MFTVLYKEAAEEDLHGLRVYEARRIMDEVDTQLTKNPAVATRRKKLLVFYDVDEERQEVIVRAIRRKGTKTTRENL